VKEPEAPVNVLREIEDNPANSSAKGLEIYMKIGEIGKIKNSKNQKIQSTLSK